MMTIAEVLELIDETGLTLRRAAVLAEGTQEIKATAGAELCEQLAAAIRGEENDDAA